MKKHYYSHNWVKQPRTEALWEPVVKLKCTECGKKLQLPSSEYMLRGPVTLKAHECKDNPKPAALLALKK